MESSIALMSRGKEGAEKGCEFCNVLGEFLSLISNPKSPGQDKFLNVTSASRSLARRFKATGMLERLF